MVSVQDSVWGPDQLPGVLLCTLTQGRKGAAMQGPPGVSWTNYKDAMAHLANVGSTQASARGALPEVITAEELRAKVNLAVSRLDTKKNL